MILFKPYQRSTEMKNNSR